MSTKKKVLLVKPVEKPVETPIEKPIKPMQSIVLDPSKAVTEEQMIVTTPFPHKLKRKGGIVHEKTYYHTRVRKNPEIKLQKKVLQKKVAERMKMMTLEQLTSLLDALKLPVVEVFEPTNESDSDDA